MGLGLSEFTDDEPMIDAPSRMCRTACLVLVVISSRRGLVPGALPLISERCRVRAEPGAGGISIAANDENRGRRRSSLTEDDLRVGGAAAVAKGLAWED